MTVHLKERGAEITVARQGCSRRSRNLARLRGIPGIPLPTEKRCGGNLEDAGGLFSPR